MKSKYPIKRLCILNLFLTYYFALLGFVVTMISLGRAGLQLAITYAVIGSLIINLNAFSDLGLLLLFERRKADINSGTRKVYLLLTFICSFSLYVITILIGALLRHSHISLQTILYAAIISVLVNALLLVLQNFIILHDAKTKADLENSRLKAANADAANQLLRKQIHPHFLFNALNILKSLYKVNPKTGEEYLIRLSDFLRASVSNNNIRVIPLKDEVKLCVDYLEMQKIRFGKALSYSISISEEKLNNGFVPSFSVQPLLENAIKHNELTEESPLYIDVFQDGERIKVSNNLKIKTISESSTGSGLSNLSERYRILSDDDLIIEKTEEKFSVSLKILSHENSNH